MRTRSFILLATFCVAFLFGVRAQDRVTSYAHLGISSQIAPDFFHGIGTDIEGGIHWRGFMASAALTLWSDYPLKNDHRYLTISRQPGGSASVGDVVDLDGKPFYWATRDVSIMIQAGYDLLRLCGTTSGPMSVSAGRPSRKTSRTPPRLTRSWKVVTILISPRCSTSDRRVSTIAWGPATPSRSPTSGWWALLINIWMRWRII